VRAAFADERRSRIVADDGAMTVEDLIPVTDVVITLTRAGYIKRTPVDAFRTQKRGGRGVRGTDMKEDDIVSSLLTCSTHDHLLVFTNRGRVYRIKAYQVPEKSRAAKGVYVANVPGLALEPGETVAAICRSSRFRDRPLPGLRHPAQGVKRTRLDDFDSPRSVLIAINLNEDDELISVAVTDGSQDIMLVSRVGRRSASPSRTPAPWAARQPASAGCARSTRRRGARDGPGAIGGDASSYLLVVTEQGYGKRTPIEGAGEHGYPRQKRGGQGVKTITVTDARGGLAGALVVPLEAEILLVSDNGTLIRMALVDVRPMGRSAQGVSLMRPGSGASVVGLALVVEDEEDAQLVAGGADVATGADGHVGGVPGAEDADADPGLDADVGADPDVDGHEDADADPDSQG
jgi:DNA gyrase subunit A